MLTITFLYLIYNLIMSTLFKVDRTKVFCGISAFAPKAGLTDAQRLLAYTKMKILSIFNQERGGDGCGMYLNGDIYKGWTDWTSTPKKDTKLFKDFIADPEIVALNYEKGVIITHSRKAAGGGVANKKNSHPFFIENEK